MVQVRRCSGTPCQSSRAGSTCCSDVASAGSIGLTMPRRHRHADVPPSAENLYASAFAAGLELPPLRSSLLLLRPCRMWAPQCPTPLAGPHPAPRCAPSGALHRRDGRLRQLAGVWQHRGHDPAVGAVAAPHPLRPEAHQGGCWAPAVRRARTGVRIGRGTTKEWGSWRGCLSACCRRPAAAALQVGRQEPVMVLRVDKEKGYIDLSKRRVSPEDVAVSRQRRQGPPCFPGRRCAACWACVGCPQTWVACTACLQHCSADGAARGGSQGQCAERQRASPPRRASPACRRSARTSLPRARWCTASCGTWRRPPAATLSSCIRT